jgi:hypothetical protein
MTVIHFWSTKQFLLCIKSSFNIKFPVSNCPLVLILLGCITHKVYKFFPYCGQKLIYSQFSTILDNFLKFSFVWKKIKLQFLDVFWIYFVLIFPDLEYHLCSIFHDISLYFVNNCELYNTENWTIFLFCINILHGPL